MDNKIYAECLYDGDQIQIGGVKLPQPTEVSIINLDESVEIKWTDPKDIDLNGAPLAEWAGTIVVRKVGSAPTSKTDGTIVIDSKVRNEYKTNGFIDTGLTNGIEYYYGIFPYTDDRVFNFKYNTSITPQPIYPDAPTNVQVFSGNTLLKVRFELPSNATGAKISYSTTEPDSINVPYGNIVNVNESPYTITGLENDTTYYVTVYSTTDKNRDTAGVMMSKTPKEAELYEFTIDNKEPDPNEKVKYVGDTIDFAPAYMDYTKDEFNYGSWRDAFFMQTKPCMLKYDGTVDYYLDENDHDLKEDGTESDVANADYEGNAMVEFPKIYYKVAYLGDSVSRISISDVQLDNDFVCYSSLDMNGNEIDHFYMPMYNGSLVNNRLRSLSGRAPLANKNRQNEVDYAKANNIDSNIIWYTSVVCDWLLVGLLLILISKSTDSQTKFGTGNVKTYVNTSNTGIKSSGTLNKKGLFYGANDQSTCVKVFGMENLWGNIWKSMAGWINDKGTQKVKMTYGRSDGSTVDGYNMDGSGYVTIPNATPRGTSGGYISSVTMVQFGLIPYNSSGSATTHYCDGFWFDNTQNTYVLVGGDSKYSLFSGAFCATFTNVRSIMHNDVGASLSCKPLAPIIS